MAALAAAFLSDHTIESHDPDLESRLLYALGKVQSHFGQEARRFLAGQMREGIGPR